MASETVSETTTSDAGTEQISRLRGTLFEGVTLGATMFGILTVAGLLLYVANDAIRPLSADPGWHLVFFLTLVVPSLALVTYFYTRDGKAVDVAYASLGIPVVGLLVGGGLVVLFIEIISAAEWLGLALGLLVGATLVYAHRRFRPEAALERLFVLLAAPLLAVVGIPALSVDFTFVTPVTRTELFGIAFSTPQLLPGVPDLFLALPVLPLDWMMLLVSVTLPAALVAGRAIAARRNDERGLVETVVATLVVVSAGAYVTPLVGLSSEHWVLLATVVLLPLGFYLEGVVRRREGLSGLLFPVVVVGGALLGAVLAETFGFAGPDPWIDWGFLTSATSTTPEDAGIYPALVGSVLMLVVIIASAFPVGVGAAIYLEEYAPDTGLVGKLVTLIEINIGNLAGVPSVVYGLLGLAIFVRAMSLGSGTVIVGGFTVGLLILPIVIISAQESIRAVPDSMRQASYGMGATRWQTTRNVVLPEALPGVLTGTILALGRAIGETAPLLMIGAAASVRTTPNGFFSRFSAMPRQIFSWSSELQPEFRYGVLAAGVVTLLVVLLLMNGTAIVIRNKYQRGS
ncbi:phosphate ABC transporter permease PstA [Halomarina ordinaria]|uniref:Phosphate transport system permease protein PstA n=1 Tax=Halomarina ordinaria TaxID=3033939 RepID=A0ABD5U9C0_9EURY|nr:phosphate ABC transporter permease PstA [Halomarina sp. PSRA2]